MKAVLFTRAHLMYQRGEIAGFAEDHAQKLIAAGIARDPEAPLVAGNVLPKGTGAAASALPASDPGRAPDASGTQAGAGAAETAADPASNMDTTISAKVDPASGTGTTTPATSAKADPASDPGTKADPDTGAKTDTKPAPGAPPAQGKRR
ncbi:hypothetical protein [Salipiger marinus]|uniref:Uncharacterized protein n=1 Tax=Salipiger marinus TaxID=555512 RepID=A0A1G8RXC5_9RHOB|nr:hypothetical protein [Salipiger marinus]SDJ21598.1 hypothetical protein SAMN04487993_102222 [Salipiger marinus]